MEVCPHGRGDAGRSQNPATSQKSAFTLSLITLYNDLYLSMDHGD